MGLLDVIFWTLLIIGILSLLFGYPENRRSAWGIALACAVIDVAILGYRVLQK